MQEFSVLYGEDIDVNFLKRLDTIDEACYAPKYWGELENTVARFQKELRQFVFLVAEVTDELVGYINFFPCEKSLYEDNLFKSHVIRDDDILPSEVAWWSKVENHLFILSIAIYPKHQGTDAIRVLGKAFFDYLAKMEENSFPVNDILATAVSKDGKKVLHRWGFQKLRELSDGNVVFLLKLLESNTNDV